DHLVNSPDLPLDAFEAHEVLLLSVGTVRLLHDTILRPSNRLDTTTLTDDNDMHALATTGLIAKPIGDSAPAAIGMATTLYANAQNRFRFIVDNAARARSSVNGTDRKSARTNETSAASTAMSTPPIAIPTSASASAAASLIPSPIIATRFPSRFSARMASTLPAGKTSARTSSIPISFATFVAV